MKFEKAIEFVLDEEGGFTDDPDDDGNWTGGKKGKGILKGTKFGISAAAYPDEDIKNMSRQTAVYLYKRDYWDKIKADYLPSLINLHVFDFAVNAGIVPAVKNLQKLSRTKQDGKVGPLTIDAAAKVSPWQYAGIRVKHYTGIAKKNPAKLKFLEGWIMRALEITKLCIENNHQ